MAKAFLGTSPTEDLGGRLAVWDTVARQPARWRLSTILAASEMADELRPDALPEELDRIEATIGRVCRSLRAPS